MLLEVFLGSLVLSIVHVVIPSHWVPIAVIGKAEGWGRGRLRRVASLAGISHSLSTILIGVAVGLLGLRLAALSLGAMRLVAPGLFFLFGTLYLIGGIRDNLRHHPHRHIHLDDAVHRSTHGVTTAILVSMFFAPCLEIETYFFSASVTGWAGIIVVGVTYVVTTVAGISLLVNVGRWGLEYRGFRFLERYDKQIVGTILITMALLTYFLLD